MCSETSANSFAVLNCEAPADAQNWPSREGPKMLGASLGALVIHNRILDHFGGWQQLGLQKVWPTTETEHICTISEETKSYEHVFVAACSKQQF